MTLSPNFWQHKSLSEMTREEWEAICDRCAKCCLHSFIDSDYDDVSDVLREGEEVIYTNIACKLLAVDSCECTHYEERLTHVPTCVALTPENLNAIYFMPKSCSYRRLHEGRPLASWHPLLNNGSIQKMKRLGLSAHGKVVSERDVDLDDFEDHIVEWPELDKK